MESAEKALRRSGASLASQIDGNTDEVAQLKGRISEVDHLVGQLGLLVDTFKCFIDEQFGVTLAPLPKGMPTDSKAMFEYAMERYRAQQYGLARTVFRHFAKSFGQDARVPEAILMIGETFRAQHRFRFVMKQYRAVWDQYPRSSVGPRALLLTARVLRTQGECDKARQMYRYVRSECKKTKEAAKAREVLKVLKCK